MAVSGVESVFMTADFISVTKAGNADWEQVVPAVTRAIEAGFGA
jgi:hypothetical protein